MEAIKAIGFLLLAVVVVVGLWVGGGFLGLWWYPYAIQRQTAIVRSSNSYVTTKQQEMMTLLGGYHQATDPGQKRAIIAQMCQDAALVPEFVPPLVSQTIAGECGK